MYYILRENYIKLINRGINFIELSPEIKPTWVKKVADCNNISDAFSQNIRKIGRGCIFED